MSYSTAELSIFLLEHNICEVTRGQQSSDAEDVNVVGTALAGTHDAPHYIALNVGITLQWSCWPLSWPVQNILLSQVYRLFHWNCLLQYIYTESTDHYTVHGPLYQFTDLHLQFHFQCNGSKLQCNAVQTLVMVRRPSPNAAIFYKSSILVYRHRASAILIARSPRAIVSVMI